MTEMGFCEDDVLGIMSIIDNNSDDISESEYIKYANAIKFLHSFVKKDKSLISQSSSGESSLSSSPIIEPIIEPIIVPGDPIINFTSISPLVDNNFSECLSDVDSSNNSNIINVDTDENSRNRNDFTFRWCNIPFLRC
jgi:hypothetical protein